MKWLIVGFLVVLGVAASQGRQEDEQILRHDKDGPDNYKFTYELSDGTKHEQQGALPLKYEGRDEEAIVVKAKYSWVGSDGVTYVVNYDADDDGFQPEIEQGRSGGVPPPVKEILLGHAKRRWS